MYLKVLSLRLWLGWSASFPTHRFGLGNIGRSASLRDGEAEVFANVYLRPNELDENKSLVCGGNSPLFIGKSKNSI